MTPRTTVLLAALAGVLNSGCAMCQNHFDEYYAAYGGVHQRSDMVCGRVGSIFRPADGGPIAPGPGGPLDADGTPLTEDEWETESRDIYDEELQPGDTDFEELPFEELPSFEVPESATSPGAEQPTDARLPFPHPVAAEDPLSAADPIGFWEVSDMEFPLPE